MIVNCPNCPARFLLADSLVPAEGRTVRCGKCAHEWHVDAPPPADPLTETAAPQAEPVPLASPSVEAPSASIPKRRTSANKADADEEVLRTLESLEKARVRGTNVPALAPREWASKPFKIAAPILACVWFALAMIANGDSWSRGTLAGLYGSFAKSTDGLAFSDVHMERVEEKGKTRFVLTGSIRNDAGSARFVPTVRVSLRDTSDKAIWGREYPVNKTLGAGEVYPFQIKNVETSFADTASAIVVDLGNPWQLMVR